MIRYLATLFALIACNALADTIDARVVGVADGDTITVVDASNEQADGRGKHFLSFLTGDIAGPKHQTTNQRRC